MKLLVKGCHVCLVLELIYLSEFGSSGPESINFFMPNSLFTLFSSPEPKAQGELL